MAYPETDHRHHRRPWSGISTGLVIIAIGVFFLFYNFGMRLPFMQNHSWWALFILVGAIAPLGQAIVRYREHGRADGSVLHPLTSAAAITTVALIFLFHLRWDRWWPLFVIYVGLWMIFKRTGGRGRTRVAGGPDGH